MSQKKCPLCGRKKAFVRRRDGTYWCNHCNQQFDMEDDGDIGSRQPDQEAMRSEERKRGR